MEVINLKSILPCKMLIVNLSWGNVIFEWIGISRSSFLKAAHPLWNMLFLIQKVIGITCGSVHLKLILLMQNAEGKSFTGGGWNLNDEANSLKSSVSLEKS